MRIAIDATAVVTGGGVTYVLNFLPALANIDHHNEYWIFFTSQQVKQAMSNIRLPANFHLSYLPFPAPARLFRMLWEQTWFPIWLRKHKIDVVLAPNDLGPLLAPCPYVLAIRNSNPYWGPSATTVLGRIREMVLRHLTMLSAKRAGAVFFISEFSRQLIAQRLGLNFAKTCVIYLGVAAQFFVDSSVSLPPVTAPVDYPYVLSVSPIRVHKDYITLIQAFGAIHSIKRGLHLLIAGAITDRPYYEEVCRVIRSEQLEAYVHFLGEIPYINMPDLYRGAELFVLPSLAETFGHPLVEAMATGIPVIATDLPVTREICRNAAVFFQPGDVVGLGEIMQMLLEQEDLRIQLAQAGVLRAKSFSWEHTAQETLNLLQQVAREKAREIP
ncbi:glycosyltransferase family 4 protein [Candidatus Poribacteria bacterium]|nr:glycosyltransferase family 4 protein [Candidatus Poribacteria bacterium]